MLTIVGLTLGFFLMLTVFLELTGSDWCSPCVAVPAMFTLCSLAALYNYAMHGTEISLEAALLLLGVTTVFSTVAYFVSRVVIGTRVPKWSPSSAPIEVAGWIIFAAIMFGLITLFFYYRDVTSSMTSMGLSGDWNENMNRLRLATSFKELDEGEGTSGLTNLLFKVNTAISFVFGYIGLHNLVAGKKLSSQLPIFASPLLFVVCVLLTGGRMNIIRITLGLLVVLWVIYKAKTSWKHRVKFSTVFKILILFVVACVLFWAAGSVVGRKISSEPLDYVTGYIGYSMVLFSKFLEDPVSTSNLFGSETLVGIYNFIGSHFGVKEFVYTYHLEWRYVGDLSLGNVYTAYRYWLHDFGYIGLFFVAILYAMFYSIFYSKACCYRKRRAFNYPLLVLSYVVYGQFLLCIKDCLLATELVITTPFILILMYMIGRYIESKQPSLEATE